MGAPNIPQDSFICLGIARGLAPYDTGNLRFNALHSFFTNNGFVINYSIMDAYYIYYLEEADNRHKGFIGRKTVPAIANYLFNRYKTHNRNNYQRYKNYAEQNILFGKEDNPISSFDYMSRSMRNKSSLAFYESESYRADNGMIARSINPSDFRGTGVLL